MSGKLRDKYKAAFFAGLGALLPTILTIFILTFCWTFLTDSITRPINEGIKEVLTWDTAKKWYWQGLLNKQDWQLDEKVNTAGATVTEVEDTIAFSDLVDGHVPWWVGFLTALVLVLGVGLLFKGYLGRQIWRALERWIQRIPVIKIIYPYAKQVTEFFFSEKKKIEYEAVVAVQYPRKGIWSVGFVTSRGFLDVEKVSEAAVVSIFIPSSPTPVTGYTIIVPQVDTIPLDVTSEEALRFTMSGGVIIPPRQVPEVSLKTRKLERPVTNPEG